MHSSSGVEPEGGARAMAVERELAATTEAAMERDMDMGDELA